MANLSLKLADVVYVAGTVNGVNTVFDQDSDNPMLWTSEVETSIDNIYKISLEIHGRNGTVSYYERTMKYVDISFVTDRTQADVDYARMLSSKSWDELELLEKQKWVNGLKGCINTKDYERIENAIATIARLAELELNTYDESIPVIITDVYIKHMLSNVQALRDLGYKRRTTPDVPKFPIVTFQQWNDIETILRDVYTCLNERDYYYCGEMYIGEIGII